MRDIVKTGIKKLDEILDGGLNRGSITTISGPTGSGKTTLAFQFLINGTKQEENGLYICLEESRESTYMNFSSYDWDIEALEKSKQILFLDYPVDEAEQLITANSAIEEIINTMGIERVVIDSIMPIALMFKDEDERNKGFLKLIANIREWDVTTLITANVSHQTELPTTDYKIEQFTDGWINIFYKFKNRKLERYLEVLKMKGVNHKTDMYKMKITRNGIEL